MRNTKKRLTAILLALATALCAVTFAAAAADGPYTEWKQYDPRWASVTLTSQTMKQVGCLATSIAMLAVQAGLRDEASFDPGVFAAEMRRAGGFDGEDDLLWEAIPKAVPGLAAENPWARLDGTQAEKTAQLGGWLDRGYQVAVAVRDGGHWVALRAVSGGVAVMMDPACAATDLFAKYPAQGVTRAALLRAETPKKNPPPAADTAQPRERLIRVAESVFAFLKELGGLFPAIFKLFRTAR